MEFHFSKSMEFYFFISRVLLAYSVLRTPPILLKSPHYSHEFLQEDAAKIAEIS